jgi:hypothetical protein
MAIWPIDHSEESSLGSSESMQPPTTLSLMRYYFYFWVAFLVKSYAVNVEIFLVC